MSHFLHVLSQEGFSKIGNRQVAFGFSFANVAPTEADHARAELMLAEEEPAEVTLRMKRFPVAWQGSATCLVQRQGLPPVYIPS
jgi:hypothetical protein